MSNQCISASILSADSGCLAKEAEAVLKAGADTLHIDVMDNHYVPHLTFGPLVCTALHRHLPKAFLDIHLMVKPVDALIGEFAKAGAHRINFHPDASDNVANNLQQIHQLECKAGLAISPEVPLDVLDSLWNQVDFILLMGVHPGQAGQTFIPEVLNKISQAKQLIQQKNPKIRLGVDGGIKKDNIAEIAKAGADTFIVGSGIFTTTHTHDDYTHPLTELRLQLTSLTL